MKFIDLYAGLGGFHLALGSMGHSCVFASEINENLQKIYLQNHKIKKPGKLFGDITKIDISKDIPQHDILCGGFPCQPFSRAGRREGFSDPKNGNHFYIIRDILKKFKTKYFILENVETLKNHDQGRTWQEILIILKKLDYDVDSKIMSPHQYGIPHFRKRIFIVGALRKNGGLNNFEWPKPTNIKTSIKSIIQKQKIKKKELPFVELSVGHREAYNVWNKFISLFKYGELPGSPIWTTEFKATYPFEELSPYYNWKNLISKKGKFGKKITGNKRNDVLSDLPTYATVDQKKFPNWKIRYIRENRKFYKQHKKKIDPWLSEVIKLKFSYQKFEWSCQSYEDKINKPDPTLEDKIIQYRPSGFRVKTNQWSPALTTNSTQKIYFPWLDRKMTIKEAQAVQNMQKLRHLPSIHESYKAFGNALNVKLVKLIAKKLLVK